MGIKNRKTKALLIAILLGVSGFTIYSLNEKETNNIEVAQESESIKNEENTFTTNSDAFDRYEKINKKDLNYNLGTDEATERLDDPYFYLTEQGLTLNVKENQPFECINDKKYGKVLLGYCFTDLEEPMTKSEALAKADIVLPEGAKEISSKAYDDCELIHYSTTKGEFIVRIAYERIFNEDKIAIGLNKEKIESLSYFREF